MWNTPSTACLVMATCETDATNQSYYGESKLHYLPAEAGKADAACSVALPKEGPVHDVQWSPAGDFFVVVAGFMPAKVGLVVGRRGAREEGRKGGRVGGREGLAVEEVVEVSPSTAAVVGVACWLGLLFWVPPSCRALPPPPLHTRLQLVKHVM